MIGLSRFAWRAGAVFRGGVRADPAIPLVAVFDESRRVRVSQIGENAVQSVADGVHGGFGLIVRAA